MVHVFLIIFILRIRNLPYKKLMHSLEAFRQRLLHRILHVRWQDHVSNCYIFCYFTLYRRFGHVIRMGENGLLKQVFYDQLLDGKCIGRPRWRYKDFLRQILKDCEMDSKKWKRLATDRKGWKCSITNGLQYAERKECNRLLRTGAKFNNIGTFKCGVFNKQGAV